MASRENLISYEEVSFAFGALEFLGRIHEDVEPDPWLNESRHLADPIRESHRRVRDDREVDVAPLVNLLTGRPLLRRQ